MTIQNNIYTSEDDNVGVILRPALSINELRNVPAVKADCIINVSENNVIKTYRWDSTSILDDNGDSVIKVSSITTGRWILLTPHIPSLLSSDNIVSVTNNILTNLIATTWTPISNFKIIFKPTVNGICFIDANILIRYMALPNPLYFRLKINGGIYNNTILDVSIFESFIGANGSCNMLLSGKNILIKDVTYTITVEYRTSTANGNSATNIGALLNSHQDGEQIAPLIYDTVNKYNNSLNKPNPQPDTFSSLRLAHIPIP
jgi:hypothetical protein